MSAIQAYDATESGLAQMRQRLENVVFDLTTTKGNQEARQARAQLVKLRTGIEAKRLELKRPILEQAKRIDSEAERITAEIVAIEKPLDDAIKADELRREQEKQAKAQLERQRIEAHQVALQQIGDCLTEAVGQPSEAIRKWIAGVEAVETGPEWEEFQQMAVATKASTLTKLQALLAKAEAAEAEARRLAEERAELERQRREAEEAQRAAEVAAAEQRRQQEAEAAAARAKIEAEQREARERIERQEREAREAREKADADARAQRAAEEERLRKEREELEAARREQEAQEAAARREREEAEAQARRAEEERQRVEREAAAAAQRERDRLLHGREILQAFVESYGSDPEFAAIVPPIREFLAPAMQEAA